MLQQLYPNQAYVEINAQDASALGVVNGDRLRLISRRGEAEAVACVTPTVRAGQAFMPMHYEQTNLLTLSHFDPYSRQPSYKNCAVRIELV